MLPAGHSDWERESESLFKIGLAGVSNVILSLPGPGKIRLLHWTSARLGQPEMRCELCTDEWRQGAAVPGQSRGRAGRAASGRPGTGCTGGSGCSRVVPRTLS